MPTCSGSIPESVAIRDEDQINTKTQIQKMESHISVWDLIIVIYLNLELDIWDLHMEFGDWSF